MLERLSRWFFRNLEAHRHRRYASRIVSQAAREAGVARSLHSLLDKKKLLALVADSIVPTLPAEQRTSLGVPIVKTLIDQIVSQVASSMATQFANAIRSQLPLDRATIHDTVCKDEFIKLLTQNLQPRDVMRQFTRIFKQNQSRFVTITPVTHTSSFSHYHSDPPRSCSRAEVRMGR